MRRGEGTVNLETRVAWLRNAARVAEADVQKLITALAAMRHNRETP